MAVEMILMESIIVALITAFSTVAAVVIAEVFLGRRTFHLLEKHTENSSKEINNSCKESTQQHNKLESDHKDILNKQDNLMKSTTDLNTLLGSTSKDLSKEIREIHMVMREEKVEQRHRYESLDGHQKTIVDSIHNLSLMSDEMEKLNSNNADLVAENQRLRQELQSLSLRYKDINRDYKDFQNAARYRIKVLEEQLHPPEKPNRSLDFDMDL